MTTYRAPTLEPRSLSWMEHTKHTHSQMTTDPSLFIYYFSLLVDFVAFKPNLIAPFAFDTRFHKNHSIQTDVIPFKHTIAFNLYWSIQLSERKQTQVEIKCQLFQTGKSFNRYQWNSRCSFSYTNNDRHFVSIFIFCTVFFSKITIFETTLKCFLINDSTFNR